MRARLIDFPGEIVDPRDMVRLRAGLIDMACEGGTWEGAEVQQVVTAGVVGSPFSKGLRGGELDAESVAYYTEKGYGPEELEALIQMATLAGLKNMEWYRRHLTVAQLIHMSNELVDVVAASADTVPNDHVLSLADLPCPVGLIVFARPIFGINADPNTDYGNEPVRVDAMLWGETHLANVDGTGDKRCISVSSFRLLTPDQTDDIAAQMYRSHAREEMERKGIEAPGVFDGPMWLPLGRTDWPIGERLDKPTYEDLDPASQQWESMMEDRRISLAMWSLIQQKRVVSSEDVHASRPTRRRLAREGHDSPSVRVIHLRRAEYRPSNPTEPEAGNHFRVRWIVKPHWRHQAYGPGRTLRRLILVPPHVKGPEGAPLKPTETVWSVDR